MTQDRTDMWSYYQETDYIIDQPAMVLRVGAVHPELDRWLLKQGLRTWTFLTAYNPHSKPYTQEENSLRQHILEEDLRIYRLNYVRGRGVSRDPQSNWPAEESVLILGLSRTQAQAWGRQYQQNAVVWGQVGGNAELLAC